MSFFWSHPKKQLNTMWFIISRKKILFLIFYRSINLKALCLLEQTLWKISLRMYPNSNYNCVETIRIHRQVKRFYKDFSFHRKNSTGFNKKYHHKYPPCDLSIVLLFCSFKWSIILLNIQEFSRCNLYKELYPERKV